MAELTNEEANDLADEILGREQFIASGEPGFFERSVDRVVGFIGDLLADIFGAIFGGVGGAAGTPIAIALLVVALGVLVFAIYRAATQVTNRQVEGAPSARVVFDEVVDPEALRRELMAHSQQRRWREAVIAGFRIAIVELLDAGIARERSGATTGDFAKAVEANRPELSSTYGPGAWAFERAFYSDEEIEESDFRDVQLLIERITASSNQGVS